MRSLVCFVVGALGHFALSTLGIVFGLRAAFETQGSFWDAPLLAGIAYLSAALLAPLGLLRFVLPASWRGGFGEIVILSLLVGAAAVGLMHAVRLVRRRRNA